MTDDDRRGEYDHFSPCPGCESVGFSIQVWVGGIQMMQCSENDCRVQEYEPRPAGTDTDK